jgi:hypothetical protein
VVDRDIIGVSTLHQPRSSIYALLDDLLVLAPGGRVVYVLCSMSSLPFLVCDGLFASLSIYYCLLALSDTT